MKSRLASSVAKILMGKDNPRFSPHLLSGDFVIIINSDKVRLTGKKRAQKTYHTKSRFVGSLKEKRVKDLSSSELIRQAVKGMLPKNSQRPKFLKRLKIFKDSQHSYSNQNPKREAV